MVMKGNKGISPLIATVLLIGFTIVLAALVIQWGGDLFKSFQSSTGVSSEVSQTCAVGLANLQITKVTNTGQVLNVVVDNRNEVDITSANLRVYRADGTAASVTGSTPVSKGELKGLTFTVPLSPTGVTFVLGTSYDVSITPVITAKADSKPYTCPKEIKTTFKAA